MTGLMSQNKVYDVVPSPGFLIQSQVEVPTSVSEQALLESHTREDLSVFFGIGMTLNIVMIIAFFLWAARQWKNNDKRKK